MTSIFTIESIVSTKADFSVACFSGSWLIEVDHLADYLCECRCIIELTRFSRHSLHLEFTLEFIHFGCSIFSVSLRLFRFFSTICYSNLGALLCRVWNSTSTTLPATISTDRPQLTSLVNRRAFSKRLFLWKKKSNTKAIKPCRKWIISHRKHGSLFFKSPLF